MPSSPLRIRDVRAINELVNECRGFGADPTGWRRHWYAGLGRMTGGDLVLGGEKTGLRSGAGRTLGTAAWGFEHGFNAAGWERSIAAYERDPEYSPAEVLYLNRALAGGGPALARSDLVADSSWYTSADYQDVCRTVGIDHLVWCYRPLGAGEGHDFSVLLVCRSDGERDFTARQKAIVQEAHASIAPLVGGPLAGFADPSPATLPPRVREVLTFLLEGDSDKQIAARMGISIHTVNQYVKQIFKYFRINTRAELLAHWIRRGWSGRTDWPVK